MTGLSSLAIGAPGATPGMNFSKSPLIRVGESIRRAPSSMYVVARARAPSSCNWGRQCERSECGGSSLRRARGAVFNRHTSVAHRRGDPAIVGVIELAEGQVGDPPPAFDAPRKSKRAHRLRRWLQRNPNRDHVLRSDRVVVGTLGVALQGATARWNIVPAT
jgi:hypothetical protein